jgi:HEAT repeat protein
MIRKDQFRRSEYPEQKRQNIPTEHELQNIQDISEFNSIVHALQSASSNTRKKAAQRLGEFGLEEAVEPLSLALFDEEAVSVCVQIIEALFQIGTDEAIAGIMDMLDAPDDNIRQIAVDTLGKINPDEASDQVIDELMYTAEKDIARSVRLAAIDALFQYESKEVMQMFSELSSDPDPEIRNAIKDGMKQRAEIAKPKSKRPNSKAKRR